MRINTIKVVEFQSIEEANDWIDLEPEWEPFQLIPDNDGLQVVFRYKGGVEMMRTENTIEQEILNKCITILDTILSKRY
jgi:hypothetical protein